MNGPSAVSLLEIWDAILKGQVKTARQGEYVEVSRREFSRLLNLKSGYRSLLNELDSVA
jgi:hypothetical protein